MPLLNALLALGPAGLQRRLGCRSRLGLRGRMGLAAAALLIAQGVVASVSHSAHDDASAGCARATGDAATSHSGCDDFAGQDLAADDSSLHWFDAVLDDRACGPSAPTWWDLLLCESAQ